MAQRTNSQMGTGSSSSNSVTQNDPKRHDVVDNCRHTQGYVEGRETICVICQEEMKPTDHTVTHCECNNAFHAPCFDALVEDATDLFNAEPEAAKCPMCRGNMRPWPVLGCPNDAVAQAEIEAARIEARRAEIEAETRNEIAVLAMQEFRDQIAVTLRITQARYALPLLYQIRSFIPPQGIPINELVRQLVASTRGLGSDGALLRQLIMTVAVISPSSGTVTLAS